MDITLHSPRRRLVVMLAMAVVVLSGLLVGYGSASAQDQGVVLGSDTGITAGYGISRTIPVPIYPGYPYPPGYPPWIGFPCPQWPTPPVPPGVPTPAPRPIPTPGPATGLNYMVCPQIVNRVPTTIQQQAIANPWTVYGYGERLNPNVPYHPLWNSYRTRLTLLDYGKPWSPCNPVVWKNGCP